MEEIILKTKNLTKYYGKALGAKDVSLELKKARFMDF